MQTYRVVLRHVGFLLLYRLTQATTLEHIYILSHTYFEHNSITLLILAMSLSILPSYIVYISVS